MKHVMTILANGFEETEAISFIDLLRRAKIKVSVLGLDSVNVKGSHDITIITDGLLKDFNESVDGIILPGGQPGTTNLANSPLVISKVKEAFAKGLLCAAICAAPTVFAKATILDGLKATCYPGSIDQLTNATYMELPVVCDKNVITSRGVGTALDFSLEIIHYLINSEVAETIRKAIVYT